MSQFFTGFFKQVTSHSSVIDNSLPIFQGIDNIIPNVDGTISVSWLSGSTSKPSLQYFIYIALGIVDSSLLFQSSNLVKIVPSSSLTTKILTLSDQSTYLVNQLDYTLGVRASDALGYIDSNVSILSVKAIGSGNLPDMFQSSLVLLDNSISTLDGYTNLIDKSSKQINTASNLIIATIL